MLLQSPCQIVVFNWLHLPLFSLAQNKFHCLLHFHCNLLSPSSKFPSTSVGFSVKILVFSPHLANQKLLACLATRAPDQLQLHHSSLLAVSFHTLFVPGNTLYFSKCHLLNNFTRILKSKEIYSATNPGTKPFG